MGQREAWRMIYKQKSSGTRHNAWFQSFKMWRWGELNSRPMWCCQVFSGRSLLRIFSAPTITQTCG